MKNAEGYKFMKSGTNGHDVAGGMNPYLNRKYSANSPTLKGGHKHFNKNYNN